MQPASGIFKALVAGKVIGNCERHVEEQFPVVVSVSRVSLEVVCIGIEVQMALNLPTE